MTELTVERKKQDKDTLTTADIANYLREHPDFFQNRPDILYEMVLPHGQGNTASLLERQASVLRNRNTELRHKLNELMAIARDNDTLFNQIKKLGLGLLEAGDLASVHAVLEQTLMAELKLDHLNLFVYRGAKAGKANRSETEVQKAVGGLLRGERIICTTLRKKELQFLFPEFESDEGSAALIPLQFQGEIGLLAIGSNNASHFTSNMDTTFAKYVGDILSRRLFHLID